MKTITEADRRAMDAYWEWQAASDRLQRTREELRAAIAAERSAWQRYVEEK